MSWSTNSQSLYYTSSGGTPLQYILQGFSLTSTEYMAELSNTSAFYDFGIYSISGTSSSTSISYSTIYANANYTYSDTEYEYTISSNGSPAITNNTVSFMNNIILNFKSNNADGITTPITCPMIRIPINSDYWLNGCVPLTSINSTQQSPYYWQGQCNVYFSADEYQQSITDIAYYCYSTWNSINPTIPIVIILDLHWCFASSIGATSGSYVLGSGGIKNTNSFSNNSPPWINPPSYNSNLSSLSSDQLPLPGVCVADMIGGSSNLELNDQTCIFWESVSSTYGINSLGQPINTSGAYANIFEQIFSNDGSLLVNNGTVNLSTVPLFLNSIFFEAFNEPFTDRLCDSSAPNTPINPYSNNYEYYVLGGQNIYYSGNPYNFTGMSQIYGTIRGSPSSTSQLGQGKGCGATNIIIFGGAENYAYMLCDTTSNSSENWDNTTNTIITTSQNCFTTLINYINNNQTLLGITSDTNNIMCCLHPYAGFYTGAQKYPGWYDPSYYSANPSTITPQYTSSTPLPGFAQFLDALTTSNTTYCVDFPIICTEIGQYDIPFNNYANAGQSQTYTASNFQYPSEYFSNSNPLYYYNSDNYGLPYFNGNYIPAQVSSTPSGFLPPIVSSMPVPPIIGYLMDIQLYNCSFSIWAIRPNTGGNGSYQVSNNSCVSNNLISTINNPSYSSWISNSGWSGGQPDATTGSWASYPQQNPSTSSTYVSGGSVTSNTSNNDPSPLPAMNLTNTTDSPYTNTANGNTTYEIQLVTGVGSSPNQTLYTTNTSDIINNNCQGADFGYIYNNIYGVTNPFNFSSS